MSRCDSCGSDYPDGQRFCGDCGAAVDKTSAPTETSLRNAASAVSHPSPDPARFIPGTVLARRYRIVGLLGRGGMGEVYRADDLKLGQPVALKFLPAGLQRDPSRQERFLNEVRIALRVTHPNVCRVYDIGEVDGQHYISMEYVDGEDLGSLLRRIERLPQHKAAQIARQLCAGLAAAHDQGILHRDLKPTNVMIDGRGRAKITDFGLASLALGVAPGEVRAGTPAYMAPEQLEGSEVTVRSDVYSLGLVLYELFTGKRAFDASSRAEMLRLERESTPTNPSSHVKGLDPTIERVILRCLETDPGDRPASALSVAATLPGGDPLAAALAAGETPSPQMVAQAGDVGGLPPSIAVSCLAFILVALALAFAASARFPELGGLINRVPLEKPPVVLARDAQELLAKLGHDAQAVSRSHGFDVHHAYLDYIEKTDPSPRRWDRLSGGPPAVYFWYRQSPRVMIPGNGFARRVTRFDPRHDVSGMAYVALDGAGRMTRLRVVPPQLDASTEPAREPDWSVLLEAAGLDPAALTRVEPRWLPADYADRRAAWEGRRPDAPGLEVRIEAAAYRGQPTYFAILDTWDRPWRMERLQLVAQLQPLFVFQGLLALAIVGGALFMARRNLRLGRGDRKGAGRLTLVFGLAMLVDWAATADHVPDFNGELTLLTMGLAEALMFSGVVWLIYVAVEPFLRRRWPGTLVSWNRLLAGRFADPLIGRDLLIGTAAFAGLCLLELPVRVLGTRWLEVPPMNPLFGEGTNTAVLLGGRFVASHIGSSLAFGVVMTMTLLFALLLLRLVLRKHWLAVAALVIVFAVPPTLVLDPRLMPLFLPMLVISWVAIFLLLTRFGVLSVSVLIAFSQLVQGAPSYDLAAWHSGATLALYGVIVALATYGFYTSLAGRPVFAAEVVPQE